MLWWSLHYHQLVLVQKKSDLVKKGETACQHNNSPCPWWGLQSICDDEACHTSERSISKHVWSLRIESSEFWVRSGEFCEWNDDLKETFRSVRLPKLLQELPVLEWSNSVVPHWGSWLQKRCVIRHCLPFEKEQLQALHLRHLWSGKFLNSDRKELRLEERQYSLSVFWKQFCTDLTRWKGQPFESINVEVLLILSSSKGTDDRSQKSQELGELHVYLSVLEDSELILHSFSQVWELWLHNHQRNLYVWECWLLVERWWVLISSTCNFDYPGDSWLLRDEDHVPLRFFLWWECHRNRRRHNRCRQVYFLLSSGMYLQSQTYPWAFECTCRYHAKVRWMWSMAVILGQEWCEKCPVSIKICNRWVCEEYPLFKGVDALRG